MHKPCLTMLVDGPWQQVRVRRFSNKSQLDCAYEKWAKSKNRNEKLVITETFSDGSSDQYEYEHATTPVTYKDYEGLVWEVHIENAKWNVNGDSLSLKEIKDRMKVDSLGNLERVSVTFEKKSLTIQ